MFALINRPEIFDPRPGNSFVEFLLASGFDVFGVDWGVPDEADADMGLAEFICDELHWAIRETRRACDADELTLLGWCIGGTLCAIYCALHPVVAVRNAALLTTPIEPNRSLYANWVGHDEFDVDLIAIAAARPVAPKRDRYSGVGALAAPARLHSRGGAPDPHAGRLALQFSEQEDRASWFRTALCCADTGSASQMPIHHRTVPSSGRRSTQPQGGGLASVAVDVCANFSQ